MFFMEIGKSRQWVLYLDYKPCVLYFFLIFIVYIVGKSLLVLRIKAISLKTSFLKLYPNFSSKKSGPLEIHCTHEWAPGERGIFMTPL